MNPRGASSGASLLASIAPRRVGATAHLAGDRGVHLPAVPGIPPSQLRALAARLEIDPCLRPVLRSPRLITALARIVADSSGGAEATHHAPLPAAALISSLLERAGIAPGAVASVAGRAAILVGDREARRRDEDWRALWQPLVAAGFAEDTDEPVLASLLLPFAVAQSPPSAMLKAAGEATGNEAEHPQTTRPDAAGTTREPRELIRLLRWLVAEPGDVTEIARQLLAFPEDQAATTAEARVLRLLQPNHAEDADRPHAVPREPAWTATLGVWLLLAETGLSGLENFLAAQPFDVTLRRKVAVALVALGERALAVRLAEQTIRLASGDPIANALLAALRRSDDHEPRSFDPSLVLPRGDEDSLSTLRAASGAGTRLRDDQIESAEQQLAALQAELAHQRGHLAEARDDGASAQSQAAEWFRRAVALRQQSGTAGSAVHYRCHVARRQIAAGDWHGAQATLRRAIAEATLGAVVEPLVVLAELGEQVGDLAVAIAAATDCADLRPWQSEPRLLLARLLRQGGELLRSQLHLEALIAEAERAEPGGKPFARRPGPAVYVQLGLLALDRGDPTEAMKWFSVVVHPQASSASSAIPAPGQTVATSAPRTVSSSIRVRGVDWVQSRAGLGQALLQLGRAAEAEAAFRSALTLAPDDFALNLGLADALAVQDRSADAAAAYQRALAQRPDHARALAASALVARALGDHAACLAALRQALAGSPTEFADDERVKLVVALAEVLVENGQPSEALRWIDDERSGISRLPVQSTLAVSAVVVRARALRQRGATRETIAVLRDAAARPDGAPVRTGALHQSNPSLIDELGLAYLAAGEPERALSAWEELQRRGGDVQISNARRARAFIALGRLGEAASALAARGDAEPDVATNAARLLAGGELHLHRGEPADALQKLAQARALGADLTACLVGSARAHRELGQADDALRVLREGVVLRSEDPLVWSELARTLLALHDDVLRANGLDTEARAAVARALDLSPDDANVLDLAASVASACGDGMGAVTHRAAAIRAAGPALGRRGDLITQLVADAERSGLVDEAIAAIEQPASTSRPSRRALARLLGIAGRWTDAARVLGDLVASMPANAAEVVELRLDRALALARAGHAEAARAELDRLENEGPVDPPRLAAAAVDVFEALGDLDAALASARAWVAMPRNEAAALRRMADIHRARGEPNAVAATLERLPRSEMTLADRRELARAYQLLERPADAARALETARVENDPEARLELAEALRQAGRVQQAVEICRALARAGIEPARRRAVWEKLASILFEAGEWAEAQAVLDRLDELTDEGRLLRARCFEATGNLGEALREFQRLAGTERNVRATAALGAARVLLANSRAAPDDEAREAAEAALRWLERLPVAPESPDTDDDAHGQSQGDSPTIEALVLAGEAHERRGQFRAALSCYQRCAASTDAEALPAYLGAASALRGAGDLMGALHWIQQALDRWPTLPPTDEAQLWYVRGQSQEELGQAIASRASYQRAAELAPDNREFAFDALRQAVACGETQRTEELAAFATAPDASAAWLAALGRLAERRRCYGDALRYYQRADEAAPRRARYIAGVGRAFGRLGKWDDALTWLRRAIVTSQGRWDVWADRGDVLVWRGYVKEALRSYDRARELGSSATRVVVGLAIAELAMGSAARAEARLRDALAAEPDRPDALAQLATLSLTQKRWPEAQWAIDRALGVDPGDPELGHLAAEVALAVGHLDDAETHLIAAERLAPEWGAVRLTRGRLAARRGKLHDAVEALEAALAIERTGEALRALTDVWRRHGRTEEAFGVLSEAVEREPGQADWFFDLAELALALNRLEDAHDALRRATRLSPTNVTYLGALGQVLRRMGRTDEAIATLREAVQLAPDDPALRRELANAEATRQMRRQFT